MEASQEGHLELVRYLLEARADVNATTGTFLINSVTMQESYRVNG